MIQTFHITPPDQQLRPLLQEKIDNLTKPKGSLGRLEEVALQVGLIQQSLSPVLRHPQNIIFAADHGIEEEGVSVSPRDVTWQQTLNFLNGGAGINFLCRPDIAKKNFEYITYATPNEAAFRLLDP